VMLVVGWDQMGYVPFDMLAYIPWTLGPSALDQSQVPPKTTQQ